MGYFYIREYADHLLAFVVERLAVGAGLEPFSRFRVSSSGVPGKRIGSKVPRVLFLSKKVFKPANVNSLLAVFVGEKR